jgi:hypothetical protein
MKRSFFPKRSTITNILMIVVIPASISFSQQSLNSVSPWGFKLKFNTDGNLLMDGQCFHNIPNDELLVFRVNVPWCWSGSFAPPNSLFLRSPDFVVSSVGYFNSRWDYQEPVLTPNRIWMLGGHLFIQGGFFPQSPSLPGTILYRNSAGTPIASFTNNGDLYIKGVPSNTGTCSMTAYQPQKWNDQGQIQYADNCYNYGNDQITYTFAQPGRASGNMVGWPPTADEVRTVATNDHLKWVQKDFPGNNYDCANVGVPGGHLVYFAIAPGSDYHWFRLDKTSGKWSHKPGIGEATNLDYSNPPQEIVNPQTAIRGGYTEEGGFMCTCGNNAFIR